MSFKSLSFNALSSKVRRLIQAVQVFLTLPDRLYAHIKELVEQGGKSIETTHIYQAPDNTQHEIGLRTIIQLDGDVINFFPDPDAFSHDPRWQACLISYVDAHYQQVSLFYKDLQFIQHLGIRITNMVATISGTLSALFIEVSQDLQDLLAPLWLPLAHIDPFLVHVFWFFIVSIVLGIGSGILFFYILKPLLFKLIMKNIKRKIS